jgi:hypothetical protein
MVTAPVPYDPDQGPQHAVSDSFLNLIDYVEYIRVGGYQGEKLPLAVNATGSRVSKLMTILKEGHYGVKLDEAKWRALAAWIDTNAQFYGGWDEIVVSRKPDLVELLRTEKRADRIRRYERMKELGNPVAYLNCGITTFAGDPKQGTITQKNGKGWQQCDPATVKGLRRESAVTTFDENAIIFDINNLKTDGKYKLGLTWWDHNDCGRKQSVLGLVANAKGQRIILNTTRLPAYKNKKQMPGQHILDLPADLISKGKFGISIQNDAGPNAVLSEIWLQKVQ